jgi:hypothetical protein
MNNDSNREFKGTDSVTDPDSPSKTALGESPMTEASETAQDWFAEHQKERKSYEERATECVASNKAQIFPLLKATGIAVVTVYYSGHGDSGQIDGEGRPVSDDGNVRDSTLLEITEVKEESANA